MTLYIFSHTKLFVSNVIGVCFFSLLLRCQLFYSNVKLWLTSNIKLKRKQTFWNDRTFWQCHRCRYLATTKLKTKNNKIVVCEIAKRERFVKKDMRNMGVATDFSAILSGNMRRNSCVYSCVLVALTLLIFDTFSFVSDENILFDRQPNSHDATLFVCELNKF